MVGRTKSIAFEELKKYWGEIDFIRPPKLSKIKKYDLVIGQEPSLRVGTFAYIISKFIRSKLVLEVHADYLKSTLPFFQEKVANYLLKRCDLVRAVSKKIEKDLQQLGVKNVVMVPSIYIKTNLYRPLKHHSSRRPIIISIGRLVEQKNFPLLLHAFKEVKKENPEVKLIIHGRGPLEKEILNLAKRLELLNDFRLINKWLSEEELVSLYNEAAILVITSKYEGGPRVAFEAGACYTPFVSTRVGILTEMVPNGVGGFYVNEHPKEIAKKISILLLDSKLRQRMGENLREIVLKNFEWNTSIKRYAEAYLKIF